MELDEFTKGMKVRVKGGSEYEQGSVESVDHDEHMVWVRMPVVGQTRTDLVDIDPGDLEKIDG
jgi:hypothetical protein